MDKETLVDEIQERALTNILAALTDDYVSLEIGKLNEGKIAARWEVISNAASVLDWIDSYNDCPTCPYLDSLEEDEEEEFCECGCGEDEDEVNPLVDWVTEILDGAYVPSLGTRIIFCSN